MNVYACSGLFVNTANTAVTEAVKYYFTGSDMPIAPALLGIKSSCNAMCIRDAVDSWLTHVPEDYDALWMVGSQWIITHCDSLFDHLHCESEKQDTILLPVTSANVN